MTVTLRAYRPDDVGATWQVFHAAVHRKAPADYAPEQLAAWSPDDVDLEAWGRRRA